jgi:hypothetical protein
MLRNSILAVIAQGIGFDGFGLGSTMRRWRSRCLREPGENYSDVIIRLA